MGSFPESPLPKFRAPENLPDQILSLNDIEAFSEGIRTAWQLGMNPIADLTDTLEGLGLLVIVVDEEKACDRFAGSFLVPRIAVYQLLGQQRHAIEWQELNVLKREFGMSMAGWLQRAKQCGVITEHMHLAMFKRFSAKGWRKCEPGEPLPNEFPLLFQQLVYRALAEQFIAESKAAELLGIPMMRLLISDQSQKFNQLH